MVSQARMPGSPSSGELPGKGGCVSARPYPYQHETVERPLHDLTMSAIQVALRGLSARQRAIADNVANVQTPNYLATKVDFEGSLANAIASGNPGGTTITAARSTAATDQTGNNVKLDDETLAMTKTNLQFQVATEAVNSKFRLLRSAIHGTSS
jgi:flagellar basal-body rod protein FlgB